jgi:hypothetical protein
MVNTDSLLNKTLMLHYKLAMGELFRTLMIHGRKRDLAKYLGVSRQTIQRWFHQKSEWVPGWAFLGAQEWQRELHREGILSGKRFNLGPEAK